MSNLSLVGALSEERGEEERSEDNSNVCPACGLVVPPFALGAGALRVVGVFCDQDCFNDYVLASQRAMDREAVQG